jgi:hypothetical protein
MKRKEVIIQILHEVSGKPKDFIDDILKLTPQPNRLEEEISDEEYEATVAGLRKEKDGIKQWLIRGNLASFLRNVDPAGSA